MEDATCWFFGTLNSGTQCVIGFDGWEKDNKFYRGLNVIFSPSSLMNGDNAVMYSCNRRINIVLYPGCQSNKNWASTSSKLNTIGLYGQLFLNRFIHENNIENANISCQINENIHIMYSDNYYDTSNVEKKMKCKVRLISNTACSGIEYVSNSFFPNIYWQYDAGGANTFPAEKHKQGCKSGEYLFEDEKAPLIPIINEIGDKVILGLNPDNELAKYDAKLWDECDLNNGKYSFVKYYNKLGNSGNYINIDDAYKLFYGVEKDNKKLKIDTNTIYFGLIGSNDKEITLDLTNVKDKTCVYLYGNNNEYNGVITVPSTVKDLYLKTISKIGKIKYKGNLHTNDKIKGLTFHYIDKVTLPVSPSNTLFKPIRSVSIQIGIDRKKHHDHNHRDYIDRECYYEYNEESGKFIKHYGRYE